MGAKRSFGFIFHVDERKEQQRNQPRTKGDWQKILLVRLACLVLILSLILIVCIRLIGQKPVVLPTLFNPIGDTAIVTAPGFDTCIAPPTNLLKTWWDKSPYRWLNVYLGGVSMFPTCGGKDLTSAWVRSVYEQGWSMLPTWVGPQAPCAAQHAVMSSDATISYAQGQVEADAAIKAANRLSFSNTAPIYFDMEYFHSTRQDGSRDTLCIQAVNAFLNGWNTELTIRNHFAGVYASASNYPVLGSAIMAAPAVAWIAGGSLWTDKYARTCTVYGNKYISDNDWNIHQRIYQYTGGHDETYGQATWNIDSDCADAPMVGHITATPVVLAFQHA